MEKTEKKMTEKQLYKAKVKWFEKYGYEEIKPRDFYREIFPENSFQSEQLAQEVALYKQ